MAKYRVVHRNPAGRIIGSADGFASEAEAIRYVKSIAPKVSKGAAQGERLDVEAAAKPAPTKGSSAGRSPVTRSRPALPPAKLNPRKRRNPPRKIDRKAYVYYVVGDGRILGGWEYREDANDSAREWRQDSGRAVKVLSRKTLERQGLDPKVNASWETVRTNPRRARRRNPGCKSADGRFVPTPSCRGDVGFPLRLFTVDGKIVRDGRKVAETRGKHLILTRKGAGLSRADAKALAKALKTEGYAIVKTLSVDGPAGVEYGVYAHRRARAHAVS